MSKKTAIVIGTTGLVGKQLVNQLITDNDFSKVKLFGRRSAGFSNQKIEEHIVDFENLNVVQKDITGTILFSCLGTTLKQAGGKQAQYTVDYTYQYEFAKLAAENGVSDYMLISSTGANSSSRMFYPRMKGELEVAVKKLSFSKITLIQPSVLSGDREKIRKGEQIGAMVINALAKVFPMAKKYRSIGGDTVAKAMITISKIDEAERIRVYKLDDLFLDN